MTGNRWRWVDVMRGLLIAHMALDHASLMFNANRGAEELARAAPPPAADFWQFLTRFTGVPVAPGFFFMAGFMIALTDAARTGRGLSEAQITRKLIVRGLVLMAVDAVVMGLPRALAGFYSFAVLSSLGAGIIALALLRRAPSSVLLAIALAVLVLHPLIDVSSLPGPLGAVLYEPDRFGAFRSQYPFLPWCAVMLLGHVVGRDALRREQPQRLWWALSAASLVAFLAVRLINEYGNAYSYDSVVSVGFWQFAKYPPDLPFLAWSFTCVFATMAVLRSTVSMRIPAWLRPLEIFGRVPFFFYVVHFYVLGIAAAIASTKVGLGPVYMIWIALLAAMILPCRWYDEKKRNRPNLVTRYV